MPDNLYRFDGVPNRPDVASVIMKQGEVAKGETIALEDDEVSKAALYGLVPADQEPQQEQAAAPAEAAPAEPAQEHTARGAFGVGTSHEGGDV